VGKCLAFPNIFQTFARGCLSSDLKFLQFLKYLGPLVEVLSHVEVRSFDSNMNYLRVSSDREKIKMNFEECERVL
jgi:hypothetical protein